MSPGRPCFSIRSSEKMNTPGEPCGRGGRPRRLHSRDARPPRSRRRCHGDRPTHRRDRDRQRGSQQLAENQQGVAEGQKSIAVIHGGRFDFPFGGLRSTSTPSTAARLPDGTPGGSPGGFVVESADAGNFYHSGDTALMMDMQLIALRPPACNGRRLCIGDHFTMGIGDAVLRGWLHSGANASWGFTTIPSRPSASTMIRPGNASARPARN